MVHDSLSSSQQRSQNPFGPFSPSFRKQLHQKELQLHCPVELGSWSILFQRHRFLLTMLTVLGFLCTIYLYFAVTLGAGDCSGLTGTEKTLCRLEQAKASVSYKGKLKFF